MSSTLSYPQKSMLGRILGLSIPNIISNITVPLLSLTDTVLAGHMDSADTVGAVGLSAAILNFSFWIWGFLRMATTGFTAQAYGASDVRTICRQLGVGSVLALIGGGLLLLFSNQVLSFSSLLNGASDLTPLAHQYLSIGIIGAPAALLLYVYNGWFIGMQNTYIPMYITLLTNMINIAVSVYSVQVLGMGVEGLALGTVVAQYVGVLALAGMAGYRYKRILKHLHWADCWHLGVIWRYIHIGKYLIIRTLSIGGVTLYFVHAGSEWGAITLGANTLLMQLFTLFSYFMDGFAYAGESLTGRYIGERQTNKLHQMLRTLFGVGAVTALVVSVLYILFPRDVLLLLSNKEELLHTAISYSYWMGAIPIVSFAAFLWDGVFVGATDSRSMSIVMFISSLFFFLVYGLSRGVLGANSLWLAFVAYLLLRSLLQTYIGLRYVLPRVRIQGTKGNQSTD